MKQVLVIEDNESQRKQLTDILSTIKEVKILEAENVEQAYKLALENTISLFLIDIILDRDQRGDVSGLKFAEALRKIEKYAFVPIVFVTSLEDPRLYAYSRLHCYKFIEKPFDPAEIKNIVEETIKFPHNRQEDKNIYFRVKGIVYSVRVNEVIYIENSKRKVIIYTTKEKVIVPYKTCDQIMDELDSDKFVKCSRYAIVNKDFIENIDYVNRYIKLQGIEQQIEIGITMKRELKDELGN